MRRSIVIVCVVSAAACSPEHEKTSWKSGPLKASPYQATLVEDAYNHRDTNEFSIRIDAAAARVGSGYFFIQPLDSGGRILSPTPQLTWTSPTDLFVTVHTGELDGQVVRQLGQFGEPRGSLTIHYIADHRSD